MIRFMVRSARRQIFFVLQFCLLFCAGFLGQENSSWAEFKIFAIPQKFTPASSREKILRHPLVLKAEPLFDSSERRWLKESGESILPEVLELTLSRELDVGDLRDWVVAERIGYLIEDRWAATVADSGVISDSLSNPAIIERGVSFARDQWALNNRGDAQPYALSGLRDLWIPGQKGEDVMGSLPIPEERIGLLPALVAVMDTGIDIGHPGLKAKIRRKESECKMRDEFLACQVEARKIPVSKAPERKKALDACDQRFDGPEGDTDKNHYPMDCEGWNTTGGVRKTSGVRGSSDVQDVRGHGTFVSGIVAAAWEKHGIRGATQLAQILPIKVFNNSVLGPARPQGLEGNADSNVDSNTELDSPIERISRWPDQAFADVMARGLLYALREGARVVNLSLHWPPYADSELMRRLIALAERRGVLVVTAAGNDNTSTLVFPCHYAGVICVGAHGPDGVLSHFSNYSSAVDLAAPGLHLLSTWPMSMAPRVFTEPVMGLEYKDGTSFAAPYVAGLLARLLAEGKTPEQATRALQLSARPPREVNDRGVLFGNVDLGRALEWLKGGLSRQKVEVQAPIAPTVKEPVVILWDGKSKTVPFQFSLKNLGLDLDQVEVRATLESMPYVFGEHLSLAQTSWVFPRWSAEGIQSFSTELNILDRGFSGLFEVPIVVKTASHQARKINLPVDVRVKVGPDYSALGVQNLAVQIPAQDPLAPDALLRTILPADGEDSRFEYLSFERIEGDRRKIRLFQQESVSAPYRITAQETLDAVPGTLTRIERVDVNQDGQSDYALVYDLDLKEGQKYSPKLFVVLDSHLKPLIQIHFENNETTVMPEVYQWIRYPAKDAPFGFYLLPAFARYGQIPPLEKRPVTPWKQWNVDVDPDFKLYVVTPEGLRTIASGQSDYSIVMSFAPRFEQIRKGSMSVLLARRKGSEGYLEYSLGQIVDGKISSELKPLHLPQYRSLVETQGVQPKKVTVLSGVEKTRETFFAGPDSAAVRVSVVDPLASDASEVKWDHSFSSPLQTDAVKAVFGVYSGSDSRYSVFGMTLDKIFFRDSIQNFAVDPAVDLDPHRGVVYESQRRYSFISELIRTITFLPIVTESEKRRRPGLLVVKENGSRLLSETIVPEYSPDGKLLGLVRPAVFRMEPTDGCSVVRDTLAANAETPSQRVFFCGDRFLRVPFVR